MRWPTTPTRAINPGALVPSQAFGQQRANEEGVGWKDLSGASNRSDILTDTGDWPAVFGFNFGQLTSDESTASGVPAAAARAAAVGGIVAAHFPTNNPLGCSPKYKDCQKDPTGQPMKNLLPGRGANAQWRAWLDLVADVCEGLAPTPILFRPFHEMYLENWWGAPYCTPAEFIAGWRYTVDYLRNTRGIHNVLLVFAPDQPSFSITSPLGYAERWPGDAYVDVAAFDHYDHPPAPHHCADSNFSNEFLQDVHMVVEFAEAHGKVPAVAEFGVKEGCGDTLDKDWWTRCFLEPIANDPVAARLAYAMTWTNNNGTGGFVPMKGGLTFDNFLQLYQSNHTLFRREWDRVKQPDELSHQRVPKWDT